MSKVREILDRVGTRVRGAEWFIILLPILEQLFAALLEQCIDTEEEAVELITEPSRLEAKIMQARVLRRMPRQGVSWFKRRARAWKVVTSVVKEANADPDAVCAAFREISQ